MINHKHLIATQDGRQLLVAEAGKPDGLPILVHKGTPGSHLFHPLWVADAQLRGIRLIGYDRPGYGGSTSHPGRTVSSVANDLMDIAAHMDLDRLAVWGISGGGPHAIASAALLPDLVGAAAVLASPAPYQADNLDWFSDMGEDNIDEFTAALDGRESLEAFIEAQVPGLLSADPKSLVAALRTLLSPADTEVLSEDFASFVIADFSEGIKDSRDGWIDDDIAFTKPWGFELSKIRSPILLMHGEQDRFVPYAHGEWLAGKIVNADTKLTPEDGHLTLLVHRIPEVHEWLLDKMN